MAVDSAGLIFLRSLKRDHSLKFRDSKIFELDYESDKWTEDSDSYTNQILSLGPNQEQCIPFESCLGGEPWLDPSIVCTVKNQDI